MNKVICFLATLLCSASLVFAAESKSELKMSTAQALSKFMKPAIEDKNGPATCWFLGQVHGYLLAMRNSGNDEAKKYFEIVKNSHGKCGEKNSLNLSETFTAEEWKRLSELQQKIETLKF